MLLIFLTKFCQINLMLLILRILLVLGPKLNYFFLKCYFHHIFDLNLINLRKISSKYTCNVNWISKRMFWIELYECLVRDCVCLKLVSKLMDCLAFYRYQSFSGIPQFHCRSFFFIKIWRHNTRPSVTHLPGLSHVLQKYICIQYFIAHI